MIQDDIGEERDSRASSLNLVREDYDKSQLYCTVRYGAWPYWLTTHPCIDLDYLRYLRYGKYTR